MEYDSNWLFVWGKGSFIKKIDVTRCIFGAATTPGLLELFPLQRSQLAQQLHLSRLENNKFIFFLRYPSSEVILREDWPSTGHKMNAIRQIQALNKRELENAMYGSRLALCPSIFLLRFDIFRLTRLCHIVPPKLHGTLTTATPRTFILAVFPSTSAKEISLRFSLSSASQYTSIWSGTRIQERAKVLHS